MQSTALSRHNDRVGVFLRQSCMPFRHRHERKGPMSSGACGSPGTLVVMRMCSPHRPRRSLCADRLHGHSTTAADLIATLRSSSDSADGVPARDSFLQVGVRLCSMSASTSAIELSACYDV